jgi:TonB-linked SusC/RagA family outer membrane protein
MKKTLLIMWCSLMTLCLHAQQRTVTGKVTDGTDGTALPGVSVLVKGTSTGVVSDATGTYSINASPTDVLVFSFIGFELQEVNVGEQTTIDITLKATINELQEVVVIGYGERERKDVTGAISNIDSKDIAKSTSMTPELAMQGRMAGVFVSTPSGNPFDRPNIQIRGVATFGYSNPLYVIDGVPVYEGGASSPDAGYQDIRSPINIMATINPNDIESISVLKDASAGAIYGVRAANGVILITTKKGKSGKPRIEFNARTGVQNVVNKFEMLNTSEYVTFWNEAYQNNPTEAPNLPAVLRSNDPAYLGNSPTYNWQDRLVNKNAAISDYGLSVSGGSDATTYSISTGYGRTEGSLVQNYLERYSLGSNVTSKISKVLEAGLNLRMSYSDALDNSSSDLAYAATAPPWQPVNDANDITGYAASVTAPFTLNPDFDLTSLNPGPMYNMGDVEYFWGPGTRANVFATQSLNTRSFEVFRTLGNVYLQVEPIKGLKVKGTISTDYNFNLRKEWNNYDNWRFSQTPGNPFSGHDGTAKGSYGERQSRNINLIKEFTINYSKAFGDHNIDLTANFMDQKTTWRFTDASSGQINSTDPDLRNVRNNPPFNGTFTGTVPKALQGYFARVSYKFRDKYYIDATVRRDGASVFAKQYRWGTFPSVAAGWRISSEQFFQNMNLTFINDLKFRGGWGELGNMETTQGFAFLSSVNLAPDYALGSGGGDPYGTQIGAVRLPNYPNVELSWERVRTTNVGFDAAFLNGDITFTAEYYSRFTEGIIQPVSLPPNTGIEVQTDLNIANVRNSGVELQLGYNKTFGDVTFNFSGNFTTVKNRVVKLYEGTPIYAAGGRVEEGYPLGYIFGYRVGGIFQNAQEITDWKAVNADGIGTNNQAPGDIYFQDLRGNPAAGEIYNNVRDSVINNNDQTYLGKTIPGFYYGFSVGAAYKGFDVSLFFQGIGDVQKFNSARSGGEGMSAQTTPNQWTTVRDRWTPENPSSTMPRAVVNDPNDNNRFSDRFVENASFMRLKNIQIGYSIPGTMLAKSGVIQRCRIYVAGTNVLTFTKWKGIDPENDFVPPTRQYMIGINASF